MADPIMSGIIGLKFEAYDGMIWRDEWDSDIDGIPRVVRIEVTATGAEIGTDPQELTPEVTLRTVVAIDRVVAPREEEEEQPDPTAATPDGSAGTAPPGGGAPTGGTGPAPTGDDSLGGGRGAGRPGGTTKPTSSRRRIPSEVPNPLR